MVFDSLLDMTDFEVRIPQVSQSIGFSLKIPEFPMDDQSTLMRLYCTVSIAQESVSTSQVSQSGTLTVAIADSLTDSQCLTVVFDC